MNDNVPQPTKHTSAAHAERVVAELKQAHAGTWAMWHSETRYLPRLIHPAEKIGGLAYGYRGIDFCFLVATDRRVIFLDKKPLFADEDEVSYNVVSGVTYSKGMIGATLILHTRIKDYRLLLFNNHAAEQFVAYIEQRCLEHTENPNMDKDTR